MDTVRRRKSLLSTRTWISLACVIIGGGLLLVNIYGEVFPSVDPKTRAFRPTTQDPRFLPAEDAFVKLDALDEVWDTLPFAERMRRTVAIFAAAIIHYWPEKDQVDPDLRVSFTDNYVLFIKDRFRDSEKYYEYYDYRSIIERGVGLCSQAASAVSDYFREEHGLKAGWIALGGHVVAYVINPHDKRMSILDADYGVYLPFGLKYAEDNPDSVAQLYEAKGFPAEEAHRVAGFYADGGNTIVPSTRYHNDESRQIRDAVYLKWAIPGILLFLAILGMVRSRARSGTRAQRS